MSSRTYLPLQHPGIDDDVAVPMFIRSARDLFLRQKIARGRVVRPDEVVFPVQSSSLTTSELETEQDQQDDTTASVADDEQLGTVRPPAKTRRKVRCTLIFALF